MTATNHVVTGVLIGTVVHNPMLALPAALASHLVLDALPHYGDRHLKYSSTKFKLILGTDIYLAALVLVLVAVAAPEHRLLLLGCGVLAASPDLLWLPDFIAGLRKHKMPVYGPVRRFLHDIQRYQNPKTISLLIDVFYFVVAFSLAFAFAI